MRSQGLVYIFTGDGKGKTSAALGVALRAVGQGKRAAMVQWYKENSKLKIQNSKLPTWQIGEHKLPQLLKQPLFEIYPMGRGFYKLPTDHATPDQHKRAAQQALRLARRLLTSSRPNSQLTTHNSQLFLLILDEVLNAVSDGLISQISLIRLIRQRKTTHVILTGRRCPQKLISLADLVTEMKNVKHPFDSGRQAVLGLDF